MIKLSEKKKAVKVKRPSIKILLKQKTKKKLPPDIKVRRRRGSRKKLETEWKQQRIQVQAKKDILADKLGPYSKVAVQKMKEKMEQKIGKKSGENFIELALRYFEALPKKIKSADGKWDIVDIPKDKHLGSSRFYIMKKGDELQINSTEHKINKELKKEFKLFGLKEGRFRPRGTYKRVRGLLTLKIKLNLQTAKVKFMVMPKIPLKILPPGHFEKEVKFRNLAAKNNPYVTNIKMVFEAEGKTKSVKEDKKYIIESFLGPDGVKLKRKIAQLSRTEQDLAKPFRLFELCFRDLINGIAIMNKNGVAHRDIKPANITLDEKKYRLRIVDFGFADKYYKQERNNPVGTPECLAPEILDFCYGNEKSYGNYKLDVFSASISLFWIFKTVIRKSYAKNIKGVNELLSIVTRPTKNLKDPWAAVKEQGVRIKDLTKWFEKFKQEINKYPQPLKMMVEALTIDPEDRPSAQELTFNYYFENDDNFPDKTEAKELFELIK